MATRFSTEYYSVLELLPKLSQAELRSIFSVLRKLDSSLKKETAQRTKLDLYRWTPLAYSFLLHAVKSGSHRAPEEIYFLPPALLREVDRVCQKLDGDLQGIVSASDTVSHSDRASWYRLYARLVSKFLMDRQIPVTIKTLVFNYDKFMSLLDQQFPEYLGSGVFVSLVLRREFKVDVK